MLNSVAKPTHSHAEPCFPFSERKINLNTAKSTNTGETKKKKKKRAGALYCFFSVVDLTCFGIHLVAQVAYRVQQQQSVAQLEARREDVCQEGYTANNPAPTTVRVEVLGRCEVAKNSFHRKKCRK